MINKIKIFLLLPILIFMTGCWDYHELNNMAIATAKEGESQTIVYSGKGETMSEAMKQIDLVIPKRLYLGHLSVTVVSEELAKNGLSNVMDFLIREPESVKRFYIILAKNSKAGDILKILSPLESLSKY